MSMHGRLEKVFIFKRKFRFRRNLGRDAQKNKNQILRIVTHCAPGYNAAAAVLEPSTISLSI